MLRMCTTQETGPIGKGLSGAIIALLLAAVVVCPSAMGQFSSLFTDIFSGTTLGATWSWENEYSAQWSLTENPGHLRIYSQVGGFVGEPEAPRNVLLTEFDPQTNCRVEAHLLFSPGHNFQFAGVIFYNDPTDFVAFGLAYCEASISGCVGIGLYIDHEENGEWLSSPAPYAWTGSDVYLRVQKVGQNYEFSASADGSTWTPIAEKKGIDLQPHSIGLFAVNATAEAPSIPADFDYFRMTPPSQ